MGNRELNLHAIDAIVTVGIVERAVATTRFPRLFPAQQLVSTDSKASGYWIVLKNCLHAV